MIEVKTKLELNEAFQNENVLIKVGTGCCGQCNLVEKNLKEIEDFYPNICFVKIDADECDEDLIDMLAVDNIPALYYYKHLSLYKTTIGLKTIDQIKEFLV